MSEELETEPSTEQKDRQCDEHADRAAIIVYDDDDSAWCEDCHVANLDAGAASGWSR